MLNNLLYRDPAAILAFVLLLCTGCGGDLDQAVLVEEKPTGPPDLYTQIDNLSRMGFRANADETALTQHFAVEDFEEQPHTLLLEAMAYSIPGEPDQPICDKLWMLELDCIKGPGDYARVAERMEAMDNQGFYLTNITDSVDLDSGEAWVQFEYNTQVVRWDFKVDGNKIDLSIFQKYDDMRKAAGGLNRFYVRDKQFDGKVFLANLTETAYTQMNPDNLDIPFIVFEDWYAQNGG